MGYRLLPSHTEDNAGYGWIENLKFDEVIHSISIAHADAVFDTDHHEDETEEKGRDKRSSFYSIPNPWATAYLYYMVMRDASHPLRSELIEVMVNFFYDICHNNVELIHLKKPEEGEDFLVFWDLAPDFIKYHYEGEAVMPLFRNKENKIIGGLSKNSLIWVAPCYKIKKTFIDLKEENPIIFGYLKNIKRMGYPEGVVFKNFWSVEELDFIKREKDLDIDEFELLPKSPERWVLKKKPRIPTEHPNYCERINKIIIKRDDLNTKIFEEQTKEIKKRIEAGNSASYNAVDIVLLEDLFQDSFIMLDSEKETETRDDLKPVTESRYSTGIDLTKKIHKDHISPKPYNNKAILYPFKRELIKSNLLGEESYKFNGLSQNKAFGIADVEFILNRKTISDAIETKIVRDLRSIAIWPPFPSKLTNVYVIEYKSKNDTPEGFKGFPLLEFYDENGENIPITHHSDYSEAWDFYRVYRLAESAFPYFIRIAVKSDTTAGFIRVIPRRKETIRDDIAVSIDFGSSHTTIAYKKGNNPITLMAFEKSRPIIFYPPEKDLYYRNILNCFVPDSILTCPPQKKEEFELNNKNWLPFRTLWKIFPGKVGDEFLMAGVIPFAYDPETILDISEYSNIVIEKNLKWSSKADYRNGFLNFLVNLILVEAEALNFTQLEIKWSYPRAFRPFEENLMRNFWNNLANRTESIGNIKVLEGGYSEAVSTLHYFVHFLPSKGMTMKEMAVTVDVGGGTSDIAFFKAQKMVLQNSIRFAGDNISKVINPSIIKVFQEIRKSYQYKAAFRKDAPYEDIMRLWPAVHNDWDGKIGDIVNILKAELGVVFEKIALFYGSICYYIGLHLRDKNYDRPLNQLAFAGNGSQFFILYTMGAKLEEKKLEPFVQLFKRLVAAGHGKSFEEYYQDLTFLFSDSPKKEVAFGMLNLGSTSSIETNKELKKMLGLDVKIENKVIPWNNWTEKSCEHISNFGDINFDQFENFLKVFYSNFNEVKEFKGWKIERNTRLTNAFKERITSYLLQQGKEELTTPLFFIALSIWLEELETIEDETHMVEKEMEEAAGTRTQVEATDEGKLIKSSSPRSNYFYILSQDDEYKLYVQEHILESQPHPNINKTLKLFFELSNQQNGVYQLVIPALVDWDEAEGIGKMVARGLINF